MFEWLKNLFGKKSNTVEAAPVEEAKPVSRSIPVCEPVYSKPLKLCVMGKGSGVNYQPGGLYSTKCLWWISEESDENGQPVFIRESEEHTVKLPASMPFTAAGMQYRMLKQLSPQDVVNGIDTDIYGRQVLSVRERFPCFDSYDYQHEHRYHRWFFLKENGRLTRIYTADESGWIHVTEDAENIENDCVELLKQVGWVE